MMGDDRPLRPIRLGLPPTGWYPTTDAELKGYVRQKQHDAFAAGVATAVALIGAVIGLALGLFGQ